MLIVVNSALVGLFAFAALHYAVKWWFSRDERVLFVFSIQCTAYVACCIVIVAYFNSKTVSDAQAFLDRIVTFGAITHAVVLHFYALLGSRRDRVFRGLVTGVMAFLAVLSVWMPMRGTVIELQTAQLPWGGTGLLPILTPPGAPIGLLYLAVIAIHGYGLFVAGTIWKRDRWGAVLVAGASSTILAGAMIGVLIDFAKLRAPYVGALPHGIFVVFMALYLSREYAARGVRLAASEKRAAHALRETQQTLAELEEEHRRLEESETARQRAMEAVVHAQRKDLASQLAAGVAHDFDNVLQVISLWSKMFLRGALPPEDLEEARRALASAYAHGQSLSRQLMALARPESRSVKRISLDGVARATLRTLRPSLPLSIQLDCEAPAALEIYADETEIRQVIYNLVLNARDAMPAGGAIQVTGGVETSSIPIAVVGGSLAAGRWATLSVTDTGPGVDLTIRERIFDLFFTTKGQDGTGLGLATVLRIAKENGGGVALESKAGSGATFKLYLPAYEPSAARPVSEAISLQCS